MDAFYASVEERDRPEFAGKPLIVGGTPEGRGVVAAANYAVRKFGVHSAMPTATALRLCPDAIVLPPRLEHYAQVSAEIREIFGRYTPLVEPLSLDEAFLDLKGTARLHHAPPAVMLAGLVKRMEDELGLSGSIGLSHNKFLAKVASDLDKPRGFSIIGKAETHDFLSGKPVGLIWGVGHQMQASLANVGIRTFTDLLRWEKEDLVARFGAMGERLWHLARGEDRRRVTKNAPVKSISNETTFGEDTSDADILDGHIWRLAETVADRAQAKDKAGRVVTLKLKRANHTSLTRRTSLADPTQIADRIYRTAKALFDQVANEGPFRLVGVGISQIGPADNADSGGDLLDPTSRAREGAERASDAIRERFGKDAIIKGRALR